MMQRVSSFLRSRWPLFLFLLCAILAFLPALRNFHHFTDRYDWRYFDALTEMSRRAVLWYREIPLWNPYSCGGEVGLANPQILDAAPTFLFILLFGTAGGFKLCLVFYTFLAMCGTYVLARKHGLSNASSAIVSVGYGLCGYHALHFAIGHVSFLGVTLFPLLLYAYERSLDEIAWSIPTGFVAAWIAVLGGTFTPVLAAELLFLWAVSCAVERRSVSPFLVLLPACLVAISVSAIRMFPVFEFISDHPRPPFLRAPDRSNVLQIIADLLSFREFHPIPGRRYWSHEYAGKLPYVIALLSAVSPLVFFASKRKASATGEPFVQRLLLLAVFGLLLSMGNFASFAPWSLLQKLPVVRDLRVPSRHLILLTLPLCLLSGVVWDWFCAKVSWSEKTRNLASCVLVVLGACDGIAYTALQYQPAQFIGMRLRLETPVFHVPLRTPEKLPPFSYVNRTWSEMRDTFFLGHGSVAGGPVKVGYDCDEVAPLQRAEQIDAGPVPQEKLQDETAGQILSSVWSPSHRTITLDLREKTTLLLNSNWNEHWKSDRGKVIRHKGRLAVDLSEIPLGQQQIHVYYRPRSFVIGALLSSIAWPLCLALWLLFRRNSYR